MRKWLVAPESRKAHRLMVLALVLIVLKRIEAGRAYFWVGIEQEGKKIKSAFFLSCLSSLTPNRQKGGGWGYGT